MSDFFGYKTISDELLKERIIFLDKEINSVTASEIVSKLIYLDSESHDDITIYINSPGGEITSGLMIYDTMNFVKSDVQTISIGLSASMAAIILMSGTKGKRKILPNSNVMLHDLSGGTSGKYKDIMVEISEIKKTHDKLFTIIKNNTNLSDDEIEEKLKNDFWLDANDALKYSVVDKIIIS